MFSRLVDVAEGKYLVYSDKALVMLGEKHASVIRVPELVKMEDGPEKEKLLKLLEKDIHLLPLSDKDFEDEQVWDYCSKMMPKKVEALDLGIFKSLLDGLGQTVTDDKLQEIMDEDSLATTVLDGLFGTSKLREELKGLKLDSMEKEVDEFLEKANPENIEAFKKAVEAEEEDKLLQLLGIDVTNLDHFVDVFVMFGDDLEKLMVENKFIEENHQFKPETIFKEVRDILKSKVGDTLPIGFMWNGDDASDENAEEEGKQEEMFVLLTPTNSKQSDFFKKNKDAELAESIDDIADFKNAAKTKDEFKKHAIELKKNKPNISNEELWKSFVEKFSK